MRIVRPGTVVGPQQQYMYLKQLEWAKWAAVDEMKKLQAQQIAVLTAAAAAAKVVTPATPPAEDEEMNEASTTATTATAIITKQLPPVTPSKHIAAAQEKAKLISPPGQPRKTPVAKRKSTNDWEEEDTDEAFPPIIAAAITTTTTTNATSPVRPQKVKKTAPRSAAPTTRAAASEQRPTRVTRSTTSLKNKFTSGQANNLTTGSPVKSTKPVSSVQPPNKIPRLAHGTTTRSTTSKPVPTNINTKSDENSNSNINTTTTKRAPPKTPTPSSPAHPSKLPTLVGKRPKHHASNSLCDLAVGTRSANRSGSVALSEVKEDSAWVSENAGAVSIPTSRTEKPSLRSSRRRRSSFSEA